MPDAPYSSGTAAALRESSKQVKRDKDATEGEAVDDEHPPKRRGRPTKASKARVDQKRLAWRDSKF